MARFSGQIGSVDLHLLRVFREVVRCGGIAAAEASLAVGRSTISRQVSELETRLGVVLCERGRAGFRLTDEGRVVTARAAELLNAVEDFRRHIHQLRDEIAGDLVVLMPDAMLPSEEFKLPEVIDLFAERAPNVRVILSKKPPNEIERELIARRGHIGLKPVFARSREFTYARLHLEENRLFCGSGHPLARSSLGDLSLDDISGHAFAGLSYDSGFSAKVSIFERGISAYADDLEGLAALILSNRYLGFLPTAYGQTFIERGAMALIDHA
ncbi:MAG: LysR family transcriptional regulator, partial [Pseudomonadota bacterium]